MLIIPYDIESQSRNADFILIARRAIRYLQRRRRCRPLSESDAQNVVSRFPCGDTTLLHNLRRQPRPFSLKSAPEGRHHHPLNPLNLLNLLNLLKPSEPSRRRRGQRRSRCRPLSEAIHNPPPSGGYNPRAKGPSTLTPKVCPRQLITLPLFLTNGII